MSAELPKVTFPDLDKTDEVDKPEVVEEVVDEVEVSPVVAEAVDRGWVPQEDWVANGGDAEDWVDAKTFVDRGKLMDVISKQNKKLKSMEKAVEDFKEYHAQVQKRALEEAREQLLQQKAEALEMNDTRRAVDIDEEIKELDNKAPAKAESTESKNEFTEYFNDVWVVENDWYNSNRAMRATADALGAEYYQTHPDASPEDVFSYVDKEIKKEFPDKAASNRGKRMVEGGKRAGGSSGANASVRSRMSSLTPEEKRIGERFVSNGLFDSLEDYVKDLIKHKL